MKTGSKTLLAPFFTGSCLIGFTSSKFSKRSGALRFREGRLLGGGGGGAGFFGGTFFATDLFGAGFAFAFALDELAAFFGRGESSSSSSRLRFIGGCGARFFAMFDVVDGDDWDWAAVSASWARTVLAPLSGEEAIRVGVTREDWVGGLERAGTTVSENVDGSEERGEESIVVCDIAAIFAGVAKGFGVCLCGV
jgi:hypothetical protein